MESVKHDRSTQIYWDALKEVMDPEFPISVVDMGLIRDIQQSSDDTVKVIMTYTSTGCACMVWIESDIENALLETPGIREVIIEVVWDPPWTVHDMTEKGRDTIKRWGVSS